ncbi:MAG: GxxExxY protein [Phycisphaerae bacterium]|mgnify:FL=1|nr:GxxExxY protein [Phycisphaerae bacterium]MBM92233.1 GxxExxY protein [Phycisphaerae bacterium]
MNQIELPTSLNQLSHQIIGCAIEVHKELGPGLLESVYEAAMCVELQHAGIKYTQQATIAADYKGKPLPPQRLDLLIEGQLILELKAVRAVDDLHLAQLVSYLRLTNKPLGLLINFHAPTIQKGTHRRINSRVIRTPNSS